MTTLASHDVASTEELTNTQLAPSTTLAQQALTLYDEKGEFAMLPFLMANVSAAEDVAQNWHERGYCLMDDGSDVIHHGGRYAFGWHNPATGKQTCTERFAAMPEHGRPNPTKTAETPVMRFPNRNDVWNALMDIVEHISDKLTSDNLIHDYVVSYEITPSLYHAISAAIASAKTDEYIAAYADEIAMKIARVAYKMVQPDEMKALIDYASNAYSGPEPGQNAE